MAPVRGTPEPSQYSYFYDGCPDRVAESGERRDSYGERP